MEDKYTEISNKNAVVLVRKVRTRNGVRLEIYSPETDRRVYLDPLLIESLSWQTAETFSDTLQDPPENSHAEEVEERRVSGEEEYTEFTNEFAYTLVRKVRVGDDARLEILSPKLDYRTYLDASLLESLTWQTTATFSRFLEEPYGPRGTH
jgi:uncharacterized protein YqiB (DUF1249 family)